MPDPMTSLANRRQPSAGYHPARYASQRLFAVAEARAAAARSCRGDTVRTLASNGCTFRDESLSRSRNTAARFASSAKAGVTKADSATAIIAMLVLVDMVVSPVSD